MSEAAILTLVGILWGVIQLLACGILAWIASELRLIRNDLEEKVEKNECSENMCRHYKEIQNLWENTRENTERIIKLEK